jgi:hypothetical protein
MIKTKVVSVEREAGRCSPDIFMKLGADVGPSIREETAEM